MTDKELIAQLRSMHWCVTTEANGVGVSDSKVALDAADRIEALEAKLAAAVDWFETIRDRAKGDYMAHTYYLDAIAALTTIKKETPNE